MGKERGYDISHRPEGAAEAKERIFHGVQDWELTTSGWLYKPETAFRILQRINVLRTAEGKDPIKLEVYATHRPKLLIALGGAWGLTNSEINKKLPPEVTPEYIRNLKQTYPNVALSDIHAEFNATFIESLIRTTIGESFLPPRPEASMSDRLRVGLNHRVYQLAWMVLFGPASSYHSINLARALNEEYGNVGLSMHVNVVEYFAERGQLSNIQESVARLLAEQERPFKYSPNLKRLRSKGIPGYMLVSDPKIIRKEVVMYHGLNGMVLGADQLTQYGQDSIAAYIDTADVTRKIHLAGVSGTEIHTLLDPENRKGIAETERLLKALRGYPHPGRLSVAFDLNPLEMGKIPEENQFQILRRLFDWADKIQSGEDLTYEDLHASIAKLLQSARPSPVSPRVQESLAPTFSV